MTALPLLWTTSKTIPSHALQFPSGTSLQRLAPSACNIICTTNAMLALAPDIAGSAFSTLMSSWRFWISLVLQWPTFSETMKTMVLWASNGSSTTLTASWKNPRSPLERPLQAAFVMAQRALSVITSTSRASCRQSTMSRLKVHITSS